jgi:hypothetical protein
MKLSILSIGLDLDNDQITKADFMSAPSFHDFDVVLIDPTAVVDVLCKETKLIKVKDGFFTIEYDDKGTNKLIDRTVKQRNKETAHFLSLGRLVITVLRAPFIAFLCSYRDEWPQSDKKAQWVNIYDWLPLRYSSDTMTSILSKEKGKKIKLVDPKSSFAEYFDAFDKQLYYEACLDEKQKPYYFENFHTIAKTHGELPVAFSFELEGGQVVFLPPVEDPDPKKLAGVLLGCILANSGKIEESEPPSWLQNYRALVPDLADSEHQEEMLIAQLQKLGKQLDSIQQQKAERGKYLKLLYEQGKFQLEPVVRDAFSLFGFTVTDADPSDGLLESEEGTAILEIEGKDDSAINIDKYSKLLNYVINDEEQTQQGRKQGILVGNGFRLTDPAERAQQFTKEVVGASKNTRFCLLTTQTLFELVCKVLNEPDNDDLKHQIRKHLLTTNGLFQLKP